MIKITDKNPYEVLGIPNDADKKTIMEAFAKKNRGSNEEHRIARQAYDALRKPEERLQIDALTPIFSDGQEDHIVKEFENQAAEKVDWLKYLDEEQIHKEDLKALTEVTIRHFFTRLPPPQDKLVLQSDFDGLQEFLVEWLK